MEPEIPFAIINKVKKIKEALASSNDIQPEKPLIIETPTSENTKVKRAADMHMQRASLMRRAWQRHAEGLLTHAKVLSLMQKDQTQKQLDIVRIVREVKRQQAGLFSCGG